MNWSQHLKKRHLKSVQVYSHRSKDPKWRLTHPGHEWILPRGDLHIVPYAPPPKQRVTVKQEQRVPTQPPHIPNLAHIMNGPPIMLAPNPTMQWALKSTKRSHSWWTWNNIPGSIPLIPIQGNDATYLFAPQFLWPLSHHDVHHVPRRKKMARKNKCLIHAYWRRVMQ